MFSGMHGKQGRTCHGGGRSGSVNYQQKTTTFHVRELWLCLEINVWHSQLNHICVTLLQHLTTDLHPIELVFGISGGWLWRSSVVFQKSCPVCALKPDYTGFIPKTWQMKHVHSQIHSTRFTNQNEGRKTKGHVLRPIRSVGCKLICINTLKQMWTTNCEPIPFETRL